MTIEIKKNVYTGFVKANEHQTPVLIAPLTALSSTDTIYTVPANKTFYIHGYVLDCSQANQTLSISDGTTAYLTKLSWGSGLLFFAYSFHFPILKFPAGTVLTITSTSGMADNYVHLYGWLE